MAATYVHLSQRDIEEATLNLYGIEPQQKKKESLKIVKCPRCKDINPENASYCGRCGLPLQDEVRTKLEKDLAEIDMEIIKAAVIDPNVLDMLAERIAKYQSKE